MKLLKNWNKAVSFFKETQLSIVVFVILAISILGLLPFGKFASIGMAQQKILLLEWGIWIFVGLFFLKDKWLKSWFLWVLVCLIIQYNRYSYAFANTVLLYVLFYQVLVDALDDRKAEAILNGICMVVWVHIIWIVIQYQDIWWIFRYSSTSGCRIFGVLANANNAGMLIALSIPAFLRRKWWWLLPIVLGSIFLTTCTGAVVAASLGLLIYGFVKLPKKKWRVIMSAVTVAFLGLSIVVLERKGYGLLHPIKHRFGAWFRMWKIIRVVPFTGLGLGQYRNVFPAIDKIVFGSESSGWFRAHNIYIELAFEQGLIGLGLMAEFVCSKIERYLKSPRTELGFIAFLGVVISLIGGSVHFLAQTSSMVIPIIYMAILVKQTRR